MARTDKGKQHTCTGARGLAIGNRLLGVPEESRVPSLTVGHEHEDKQQLMREREFLSVFFF